LIVETFLSSVVAKSWNVVLPVEIPEIDAAGIVYTFPSGVQGLNPPFHVDKYIRESCAVTYSSMVLGFETMPNNGACLGTTRFPVFVQSEKPTAEGCVHTAV
jgi:hypothetical protein